MRIQPADLVVIIGYFILMLAVGVYFKKFMSQTSDYFTARNQVPWWLAGVSHYMSSFSALAFVMYAEVAYRYGWVAVTLGWCSVPACFLAAWWIAPRWRRIRANTPVEFLEQRFNPMMRQLFAWSGFPLRLSDDGLKLYGVAVFISVGMGVPLRWAIGVTGVVMVSYTFMGGLWAVAVTDFVQFLILLLVVVLLLPLAWLRGGGIEGLLQHLPSAKYMAVVNPPNGWLYIFSFVVLMLVSTNASWSLAQRFYSVKSEKDARKVAYLAGVLHFIGPPIFFFPILFMRHLMPDLAVPRYVYAVMADKLLPVGMMGLLVIAMLSSTMSCLSGDYNVLASVATKDIYQRLIRRSADERKLLKVARITTAFIGLAVIGVALWVSFFPDIPLFNIMVMIYGIAVAPMMLPLLGGLLFHRLTWRGAIAGFVAGLLSGIIMLGIQLYYLPTISGLSRSWIQFDFQAYTIFVNLGVTAAAMIIWSLIERRRPAEESKIAKFFAGMAEPELHDPQQARRGPSPFYIIGLIVMSVGLLLLLACFFQVTTLGLYLVAGSGIVFLVIGALLYYANVREKVSKVGDINTSE